MYGRVTAIMEWIVEHIQDGECHYVQKYIDESISKKRKRESKNIKRLEETFEKIKKKKENEIDDEKWEEIVKDNWPCECTYCSPKLDYNYRLNEFMNNSCFPDKGRYMTDYRKEVGKLCGVQFTCDGYHCDITYND